MFKKLFMTPETVERYRAAPLTQDRLRYLRYREETGASHVTLQRIAIDQPRLVYLLDLNEGENVELSQIEAAAVEWSRPEVRRSGQPASPEATAAFTGRAIRWLRFVGRLEEPEQIRHSHTGEVAAYETWMRRERGLSEETIVCYCRAADEFFIWFDARGIPLPSVSITDIDHAILAKKARSDYSRTTIRIYAKRLRAFLHFAEYQGWCAPGTAAAVIPPRVYPDEKVPSRLSRKDVQRLLHTTNGDRPADKRDRAILMLFIAYGLRASEVGGLQLDDLDWEEETLSVRRPKPGRTHLYPLSPGVGKAILRYVREVRPSRPERTLFFTLKAPIKPLHQTALTTIVSRRLGRLGIVTGRRGAHTLRHAAAQTLLDQGMSMKVIGDYLGHRSPASTAIYAKIDVNALREVADFDLGGMA